MILIFVGRPRGPTCLSQRLQELWRPDAAFDSASIWDGVWLNFYDVRGCDVVVMTSNQNTFRVAIRI